MAVRMALFRTAPKKTRPEREAPAEAGPESEARPETKPVPKQRARWKRRQAADPDRAGRPETRPETPAGTRPEEQARPLSPRPRRPPVLQRHTLFPLLARAAVLAVAIVCMLGFAVALARVTLVPSPSSDALIHTNLRPGASIRAYLDQPSVRDSVKQLGGNVLLGVPFGILLPMLFPKARGLVRVVILTALVMLLVETAQGLIVEGRAFDIDDVILNTAGALIGYLLLGRRLGRALHPRRTHWYRRRRPTPSAPR